MMRARIGVFILLSLTFAWTEPVPFDASRAWGEFDRALRLQYAYLDDAGFDARSFLDESGKRARKLKDKASFLDFAQNVVRHFHDPHLNLGPWDAEDYSVIPTGSDIWAVYRLGRCWVEDVKAGGAADLAGIRPDQEILSIDQLSIDQAIEKVFGRPLHELSDEQVCYGLNLSLAGIRHRERRLEVRQDGILRRLELAPGYQHSRALEAGPPIYHQAMGPWAYIRFNNSMGRADTVAAFDKALDELLDREGLILDLRNIPSGGNTGVAEPILGHFVRQVAAYQLYQSQTEETPYSEMPMRTAFVRPRAPYYSKPVVALVGRWTGSMGEGMAIGLDAIGARAIVGAPMADLLGAITVLEFPTSGGRLEIPIGRLYHVNGTSREDFVPEFLTIPADRGPEGQDPALDRALQILGSGRCQ